MIMYKNYFTRLPTKRVENYRLSNANIVYKDFLRRDTGIDFP